MLRYHSSISKKWREFAFSRQILMIANELNRACNWIKKEDFKETKLCYERAFELLYLTIQEVKKIEKLKELLRVKEMLALFYIKDRPEFEENSNLLKNLLLLDKDSFCSLNQ
jgi:hypothetical protein